MKMALFMGCKIPFYMERYGSSTIAVLKAFGIKPVELKFTCCGYPNRDISFKASVYSAARNIALAEKKGMDIVTPCKCCFGSLAHAAHLLKNDAALRDEINDGLRMEKLEYRGISRVRHLLTVLSEDVGPGQIASRTVRSLAGVSIAAHYGCHALRPSAVTGFDDPFSPTIFERLIGATGATPVDWPRRLDCCGNPLHGKNDDLSDALMRTKLTDARQSGAQAVCTACTYCQIQFDTVQSARLVPPWVPVPSILVTQLIGYAMGLPEKKLGIEKNLIRALLPK